MQIHQRKIRYWGGYLSNNETFRTHARSYKLKTKDMHRMHLDVDTIGYKYSPRGM